MWIDTHLKKYWSKAFITRIHMETQISWQLTAFICLFIRKFVGNENLTEGSSSFILHLNKINSDLFKKNILLYFFQDFKSRHRHIFSNP